MAGTTWIVDFKGSSTPFTMFLLLMRIRGLWLATLVRFSEQQVPDRLQRPRRDLLPTPRPAPHSKGASYFIGLTIRVNWVERDERQKINYGIVFSRDNSRVQGWYWRAVLSLDKAAKQHTPRTVAQVPHQARTGAGKILFHRGTISAALRL